MKNKTFYHVGLFLSLLSTVSIVSCGKKQEEALSVSPASAHVEISDELLAKIESGEVTLTPEELKTLDLALSEEQALLTTELAEAEGIEQELQEAREHEHQMFGKTGYLLPQAGWTAAFFVGLVQTLRQFSSKGTFTSNSIADRIAKRLAKKKLTVNFKLADARYETRYAKIDEHLLQSLKNVSSEEAKQGLRLKAETLKNRAFQKNLVETLSIRSEQKALAETLQGNVRRYVKPGVALAGIGLMFLSYEMFFSEDLNNWWISLEDRNALKTQLGESIKQMIHTIDRIKKMRVSLGLPEAPNYDEVLIRLNASAGFNENIGYLHILEEERAAKEEK